MSERPKVIRPRDIQQEAGISNVTAWRLEKKGFFPRRRQLTPGGSVGWLAEEIEEWRKSRLHSGEGRQGA